MPDDEQLVPANSHFVYSKPYCCHVDDLTRLALDAGTGDRLALGAFIRSSQTEVWRLCVYLVGREDADDVAQEVFVQAWLALPGFRGESSARTWLLTIARRVCVKERNRLRRPRAVEPGLRQSVANDQSEAVVLEDLVMRLDPDRRLAFGLTQWLGLSYEEASRVCGCEIGTIRSRVSRARRSLIEEMALAAVGSRH